MKLKRALGFCALILLSLLTSACFTIEKEIFLNADGSGELVLRISMPDVPENLSGASGVPQTNPAQEVDKFKKEVMTKLPATVKLKEAKQVKQNGIVSFYALLEFKNLKDTEAIFAELGKGSLNEVSAGSASEWTSQLERLDGKSSFTERLLIDVSASSKNTLNPPPPPPVKKSPPPAKGRKATGKTSKGATRTQELPPGFVSARLPEVSESTQSFEDQMTPLLLSLINLRVVLHTPAPISESNADILLSNNRIAVWNCSLIKFSKDKQPIEMKAKF
jgi:hypothetical protein